MTQRTVTVLRPGLLTTVQDLGRWGYQALGVPVAGAMDTRALRQANALVGNGPDAAALEVTLLGPVLRADAALVVALTGGAFALVVNDVPAPFGRPVVVPAGAAIAVGSRAPDAGARAYLAIDGGVATVPVLGSRSTHLVSRMGGHEGRALVAGDVLPLGPPALAPSTRGAVVTPVAPPSDGRLRVLLGPQHDWFDAAVSDRLLSATFTVGRRSDRMGFRLDGPPIPIARPAELLSEPVPFGAIQVPAGGEPILLMADRQTAGGYPKIATVVAADLPAAGQLAPGDAVRFVACTRAEARAALIAREREVLRAMPEVRPA